MFGLITLSSKTDFFRLESRPDWPPVVHKNFCNYGKCRVSTTGYLKKEEDQGLSGYFSNGEHSEDG